MTETFHSVFRVHNVAEIHIVDLRKDPEKWQNFVREQAAYLKNRIRPFIYADYQHPRVRPMYGRSGDAEFHLARNAWERAVDAEFRKTPLRRLVEGAFEEPR